MAVVMVVIMVMRTMIVNMTVFNSGSEILEHQLDKKSGQYKCADHLDVIVLYVKFGKDVRYRNGDKIRSCEYEHQFIVCIPPLRHQVDQKSGKQRGEKKYE